MFRKWEPTSPRKPPNPLPRDQKMERTFFDAKARVCIVPQPLLPHPHIGDVIVFVVVVGVVVVMIADGFCRVATPPSRVIPMGRMRCNKDKACTRRDMVVCWISMSITYLDCYDWKQLWTTQGKQMITSTALVLVSWNQSK